MFVSSTLLFQKGIFYEDLSLNGVSVVGSIFKVIFKNGRNLTCYGRITSDKETWGIKYEDASNHLFASTLKIIGDKKYTEIFYGEYEKSPFQKSSFWVKHIKRLWLLSPSISFYCKSYCDFLANN